MTSSTPKSTPPDLTNLRVRMYWGDLLYDTRLVSKGQLLSAGRDRHDTFMLPPDRSLSSASWKMVRRVSSDAVEIQFHPSQRGHIRKEGRLLPLSEAARLPEAVQISEGLYRLRLPSGSEARLVSGDSTFYVDWIAKAPHIPRIGKEAWREFGVTSLVGSLLLALLTLLPRLVPESQPARLPPERLLKIINEADFAPPPAPAPAPPAPEPEPAKSQEPQPQTPKPATSINRLGPTARKTSPAPEAAPRPPAVEEDVDLSGLVQGLTGVSKSAPTLQRPKLAQSPRPSGPRVTGGFGIKGLAESAKTTVGLGETVGQGTTDVRQSASITLSSPRIVQHGGLTQDEIDRVIRSRQPGVRKCYEKALASSPGLTGQVQVRFVVGNQGSVTLVNVVKDSLGKPAVTACLMKEIRSFQFPNPEGGRPVAVDLPLRFEPDVN